MEKMAFWKQALLSLLLILAAATAWQYRAGLAALWASGTAQPSINPVRQTTVQGPLVIVDDAEMVADDLTYSAIGTGFAQRAITLRAPDSGEVTALEIAPSRRFSAGDVLMRLDDTDERLAVDLAEARLERATSERDRFRSLQDRGAAAITRLEEAETAYKVARIELDRARANLADRTLRAPFDGVSGLATVELGDRVATDDMISSFDDRSRILVEFDLPEALLGRVETGLDVVAETPAVERRSFDGEIAAIDSRIDAATRTARIRAAIENSGDLLRPGASFSLRLDLPGERFPAVPELALQYSRGSLYVWRVTDGTAEQVEVSLVRRRGGKVILDGPLAEGDAVVVEGTQRLNPGDAVQVLNQTGEGST